MSEASKRVEEKIINGQVNYNAKAPEQKKESVLKKIILWPFKTLLEMFALDTAWEKGASRSSRTRIDRGYSPPHHSPSPASFREQHHFNPEAWVIKEMQAEAYHSMVDGKGDHDCGHDHDEH